MGTNTIKKCFPSIREYDSVSINPFDLDNANNKFRTHYTHPRESDGYGHKEGTIEFSGKVVVDRELVTVDYTEFTKFFKGSFRMVVEMSNPARGLLHFIIAHIHSNCDFIWLPVNVVLKFCNYERGSRIVYYVGVKELLAKKVIAPKTSAIKHEYWINANLFFTGDRTKLLTKEQRDRINNKSRK